MTDKLDLFFDLDGTLTDPRVGIVTCIQFALRRLGAEVPDGEALTWCIGPPLRQSFVTLLGSAADADLAVSLYRERFSDKGLYENNVYEGIPETLAHLSGRGHRLHVATSKPHVYANRILAHFELDRFFERVFGSELDGTRADKGELLSHALGETGARAEKSIMIGDRRHDMAGARANGMRAIGVLYGYGNPDELTAAGAEKLAAVPADLPVQLSA